VRERAVTDAGHLPVVVRPESAADHDAIRSLVARAFAGHLFSDGSEPRIVDELRRAGALASSLVAVMGGQVVGHVAFSALVGTALHGWYALGPISVEPAYQRRGVGAELIETGLRDLRSRGARGCALVGDHRYYRRFGFLVVPDLAPSEYLAEHFQVLAFDSSRPQVPVAFHPAFSIGSP